MSLLMPASVRRWWFRVLLAVVFLALLAVPTGIFWNLVRPVFHKELINKYAAIYKFDPLFVMALVKVESSFQKTAESSRGAVGLMQLMPATALDMAQRVGRNVNPENLMDPEVNIHLGIHFLYLLRQEFKGDTNAVLAAYNAGPTNAHLWRQDGLLLPENIPFSETRAFVEKVRGTYAWLKRFQKIRNALSTEKGTPS